MNYFFYDGNCPFCSKTAMRLKELCLSDEIKFLSFRDFSESQLFQIHKTFYPGMFSPAKCSVYSQGIRYPGFSAIRKFLRI